MLTWLQPAFARVHPHSKRACDNFAHTPSKRTQRLHQRLQRISASYPTSHQPAFACLLELPRELRRQHSPYPADPPGKQRVKVPNASSRTVPSLRQDINGCPREKLAPNNRVGQGDDGHRQQHSPWLSFPAVWRRKKSRPLCVIFAPRSPWTRPLALRHGVPGKIHAAMTQGQGTGSRSDESARTHGYVGAAPSGYF